MRLGLTGDGESREINQRWISDGKAASAPEIWEGLKISSHVLLDYRMAMRAARAGLVSLFPLRLLDSQDSSTPLRITGLEHSGGNERTYRLQHRKDEYRHFLVYDRDTFVLRSRRILRPVDGVVITEKSLFDFAPVFAPKDFAVFR